MTDWVTRLEIHICDECAEVWHIGHRDGEPIDEKTEAGCDHKTVTTGWLVERL